MLNLVKIKFSLNIHLPQACCKPVLEPDLKTGFNQYGGRQVSTRGDQYGGRQVFTRG